MLKTKPIFRPQTFVMTVLLFFSCNTENRFENDISPPKILIPDTLKGLKKIEAFVNETESEINYLSAQTQYLIEEYRIIPDKNNKKNSLMVDVKRVTINGRICATFTDLSEIYCEIDLQETDLENQLNAEQKLSLNLVSNQLKEKIEEVIINLKSFEKQSESGKIIFY